MFNQGLGCGACYEITCLGPFDPSNIGCLCSLTTPTVTIQVMDQCPECSSTHFDLDPTSMARIVGPGLSGTCGVISIEFRRVNCDHAVDVTIRAGSGTSASFYDLFVDDVAGYGALNKVELKSSGSVVYNQCSKSTGPSKWNCAGPYPLTVPLTVRLTDSEGRDIEADDVITSVAGGLSFPFGSNFDPIGSGQRLVIYKLLKGPPLGSGLKLSVF